MLLSTYIPRGDFEEKQENDCHRRRTRLLQLETEAPVCMGLCRSSVGVEGGVYCVMLIQAGYLDCLYFLIVMAVSH